MPIVKLFQIFSVQGFNPSKASLYLRRVGQNNNSYFDVSSHCIIDATNFLSIFKKTNKLHFEDSISNYTGSGYLKCYSLNSFDYSYSVYPIKSLTDNIYKLWCRIYSPSGSIKTSIILDDNVIKSTTFIVTPNTWQWINFNIVLPDNKIHYLGIRLEENNSLLDKIEITNNTSYIPNGTGSNYLVSPFITCHLRIFNTDSNLLPNTQLFIYDYKNSINEIVNDDWYNFDLKSTINFSDGYYAIVLTTTGTNISNYILWDLINSEEYEVSPSGIKYI